MYVKRGTDPAISITIDPHRCAASAVTRSPADGAFAYEEMFCEYKSMANDDQAWYIQVIWWFDTCSYCWVISHTWYDKTLEVPSIVHGRCHQTNAEISTWEIRICNCCTLCMNIKMKWIEKKRKLIPADVYVPWSLSCYNACDIKCNHRCRMAVCLRGSVTGYDQPNHTMNGWF